jgi:hypothetical protein
MRSVKDAKTGRRNFPVQILGQVVSVVQRTFLVLAEQVGAECGIIRRERKFNASTLAQTLVLGLLQNPRAKDEALAQTASYCGVSVTPQAIAQRFTWQLVEFLERLFERSVQQLVSSQEVAIPLLKRFNGVYLQDSSTIALPAALATQWPGCGGNGSSASLKVQTRLNLSTGELSAARLERGNCPDQGSSLQRDPLPAGSLRLADLGYFCIPTLAGLARDGAYWITRIQSGTAVFQPEGRPLALHSWLRSHASNGPVEIPILLGAQERLPCRLLAFPAPPEVVARRRQSLYRDACRKGRTPSRDRLDWCQWTVFVTNVEPERLTLREAVVLYRARWQIELLFKLWKSHGLVDEVTSQQPVRQAAEVFARLLAVMVQHWLLVATIWKHADRSLVKAIMGIRRFASVIPLLLQSATLLLQHLQTLGKSMGTTARLNPRRKKPNTCQLLLNPDLLEYCLT